MFYVYILKCADQSLYTGWTNDLTKRLEAHLQGKASKYTRSRLPVKIVYYEEFEDKIAALKREYRIKQLTRDRKIQLIGNFSFSEQHDH